MFIAHFLFIVFEQQQKQQFGLIKISFNELRDATLMKWQLIKCVSAAVQKREKKERKNELKVRVKFNISKPSTTIWHLTVNNQMKLRCSIWKGDEDDDWSTQSRRKRRERKMNERVIFDWIWCWWSSLMRFQFHYARMSNEMKWMMMLMCKFFRPKLSFKDLSLSHWPDPQRREMSEWVSESTNHEWNDDEKKLCHLRTFICVILNRPYMLLLTMLVESTHIL